MWTIYNSEFFKQIISENKLKIQKIENKDLSHKNLEKENLEKK